MRQRTLRRAGFLSLPVAILIACGADESSGPDVADACGEACDASAGKNDATTADGSTMTEGGADAHADATTSDAAMGDASDAGDAAMTDAGDAMAADAGDAGDANVVLADSGAPTGPTLLLSDTTANTITLLTTAGAVLHTYSSPVSHVTGVSHDRRARNGFWVMDRDAAQTVHKVAWSGAALPSVTTAVFPGSSVRGLDHWVPRDAGPDADLLTYVLKNGSNIDALNGINVGNGAGAFQMGFYDGKTFDAGFWGVSMLNFSESGNEMLAWVSHDIASDALERWRTASYQTGVAISLAQPRGITRTESGEFWVVDAATKKVFHLDATGATLGSFSTPGNDPAGLSYDPGP